MKRKKFRHILKSLYTFANVFGAIFIGAMILVCGVAFTQRNKELKGSGLSGLLVDIDEESQYDIFQTELIAAEIRKARRYQQSRPKKFRKMDDGSISPFDDIFKAYADTIGWDWMMLAAVAKVESNFKPEVVSPSGAKGLMQLMPATAANYGCPDSLLYIPENGIRAGALLLKDLERRLRRRDIDDEAVYFALASFHAGLGHVYDAITLADSLGLDPTRWFDNVEKAMKLKAEPRFYNLPYLRLGQFNGNLTARYVYDVLGYYEAFKD